MGSKIYYHFFDRELRQSMNANLSDKEISKIISVSLLMTDDIFYIPISNIYESSYHFPISIEHIKQMELLGLAQFASSHISIENFIASRQELYKHDKDRYPMYFNDDLHIWTHSLIILEGSTTEVLRRKFQDVHLNIKEFERKRNNEIDENIISVIEKERSKAVTYSLFKDQMFSVCNSKAEYDVLSKTLKRKISECYTNRYLDIGSGTLITGIKELSYFDFLAKNMFSTNYYIYSQVLSKIGVDINDSRLFDLMISLRKEKSLFEYVNKKMNDLMLSLERILCDKKIGVINDCNRYLYSDKTYSKVNGNEVLFKNISEYISDICSRNRDLQEELDKMDESNERIVIIAVTTIEMKALLKAVKKYCTRQILTEKILGDLVYREVVGCKVPVYIVQSEMGVSGNGSIINTLHKICKYLKPNILLMVGIAFGINEENQKIGDILVSKQVWSYEPGKVCPGEYISRGDKVSADSFLLQLFRSTELDYDINVHFGLLASGEKLINSKDFIDELKAKEKEIIGGDMEAAGLVSVCSDRDIKWIIIKSICDWGYKKEDNNQVLAANNACDFLMKGLVKKIL